MKYVSIRLFVLFSVLGGFANAQWTPVSMPLEGVITYTNYVSQSDIYVNQSYTYFPIPQQPATIVRIFKSSNNGASWALMYSYSGQPLQSVYMTNTTFVNSSTGIFGLTYGTTSGVFKTTNAGLNWSFVNIPFSGIYVSCCNYLNDSTLVVLANTGGTSYQILKSTNSGSSWSSNTLPLSDYKNNMYFVNQNTGFIVTSSGSLLKTTDAGSTWNVFNSGMTVNFTAISFFNSSTGFIAGNTVSSSLIFKTTNGGVNWSLLSSSGLEYLSSISCQNPSFVYVSGANRLIKSTNSGENWDQILSFQSVGNSYVSCFNKDTLVVGKLNVIYRSYNGGTFIEGNSTLLPGKFVLFQNYPNPFNNSSKLKITIAKSSNIKIIVYDVKGVEVKTLINKRMQSGTHEAMFDGSNLNSGVYFCKLIADGFTETKKMILMK